MESMQKTISQMNDFDKHQFRDCVNIWRGDEKKGFAMWQATKKIKFEDIIKIKSKQL